MNEIWSRDIMILIWVEDLNLKCVLLFTLERTKKDVVLEIQIIAYDF